MKDGDNENIVPACTKGSSQLKICGCPNTLMACLTRLITNHIPIGEYRLRLFPNEPLDCPCQKAEIETRQHSLFNCERFKKSWNPKRESIFDILTFLELNPGAFSFQDSITQFILLLLLYNQSSQSTCYILHPHLSLVYLFSHSLLFKQSCSYHSLPPCLT